MQNLLNNPNIRQAVHLVAGLWELRWGKSISHPTLVDIDPSIVVAHEESGTALFTLLFLSHLFLPFCVV